MHARNRCDGCFGARLRRCAYVVAPNALEVARSRFYDERMRGSMLLCALSLALAAPLARAAPAAAASDARALLERGLQLHREASYAASVAALEQARAKGTLESAQRVECAFYLAADYVALNSLPAARRELRLVLAAAPDYELPLYTSPKVVALFDEVRDELERAPRLRPLPPERRGARLTLRFAASRAGGSVYGAVFWRWHGEAARREVPLGHAGEELVARVDLDRGGALEYWAEARAPLGALSAGSAAKPLELPVVLSAVDAAALTPAPADERSRSRGARLWWLWTSIGVVAAAGVGVGLYFALRPTHQTADAVLGFPVQ
jgi:hypothetical protein